MKMKVTDYTNLKAADAEKIAKALNEYLASLQTHYFNLLGYHWHIVGKSFFSVHEVLEKMYDHTAEQIDGVAERVLQLNGVPVRKFSDILKLTKVKESEVTSNPNEIVSHILETYKGLTKLERQIIEIAEEAGDVVTADQLTGYLIEREKTAWMLVQYSISTEC